MHTPSDARTARAALTSESTNSGTFREFLNWSASPTRQPAATIAWVHVHDIVHKNVLVNVQPIGYYFSHNRIIFGKHNGSTNSH